MTKEEKDNAIKEIIAQRDSLKETPVKKFDTSEENIKRINSWRVDKHG